MKEDTAEDFALCVYRRATRISPTPQGFDVHALPFEHCEESLVDAITERDAEHAAALAKAEERCRVLEEALRPFADSAAKAEANQVQSERLGMGRMTDDASPGWGIKIRHLKAARAALEGK